MARELVAKLKFWFGKEYKDIFDDSKYDIEFREDYVYVYSR